MLAIDLAIDLRPVCPADDELIARLFAESRPDLDLLPADLRGELLDLQQRAQHAEHAAAYPGATHDIVVANGVDVGRIILDVSIAETRVVDLVVARDHRRRGIATAVLADVLAQADDSACPVVLSVWPTNHPAIDLYTGLGFETVAGDGVHVAMRRDTPEQKDRS